VDVDLIMNQHSNPGQRQLGGRSGRGDPPTVLYGPGQETTSDGVETHGVPWIAGPAGGAVACVKKKGMRSAMLGPGGLARRGAKLFGLPPNWGLHLSIWGSPRWAGGLCEEADGGRRARNELLAAWSNSKR